MEKKILIVDDDYDVREYLKIIFESHNYLVEQSENVSSAEEKLSSNDFDLMVLDVMMERDSDGFMFAQRLKSRSETKDLPILMVTSVNEKTPFNFSKETDGSFLPVDAFIEKPIEYKTIIKEVERLIN